MKKIAEKFFLILITTFVIQSCDIVDPPYKAAGGGDDIDETLVKALIEDYTGHGCVNCPTAAVTAQEIKAVYGKQVVIMSVHAGFFATPNYAGNPLFADDFTTPAGDEWDTYFGISEAGNPNGMVNRIPSGSNYILPPGSWATSVSELVSQKADVLIGIETEYLPASRQLNIQTSTKFVKEVLGEFMLTVCITEDSLVAPQANNNPAIGPVPIDTNYVNNHVLRGSINGTWGELIANGDQVTGFDYINTFNYTIPEDWDPKHLHVVAFVFDNDIKSILNVAEKKVLE